jgi:putative transposase
MLSSQLPKKAEPMACPHCESPNIRQYLKRTSLGYRVYRCHGCKAIFNERTGTPFNEVHYPTDVVMLVVLWRIRYKLSLCDLVEMLLVRGYAFTHETVRDWEARFAPLLAAQLRSKRRGQAGKSWYVDETYVKVKGEWHYTVSGDRPRRQLGRHDAEQNSRFGGRQGLF